MELSNISKKMYQEGQKDEELVMNITHDTFRCNVRKSTKYEDTHDHVDFWCIKNGKEFGIDVKGLRKNKRTDTDYDDTINWIELLNVKGEPGWIYGKSSYIAFMTKESILYVPTKDLVNFVESKVRGQGITSIRPDGFYKPYRRKDRQDLIIKVPTSDLRNLAKHEIKY